MADRAFIVPRRNDIDGMNMQVTDLRPNTSDRNLIYDGAGQTGYLKWSLDTPDTTTVEGDSFVSGSTNTSPLAALADDDTTGGGNDVQATTAAQFGLLAYIQDRIQPGGVASATADPATPTEALNMADALTALVEAGSDLTLTDINTALSGVVADTDLDGAAANSRSFGSVEDILRILSGEVYRVRAFTIIGEDTGGTSEFYDLATREGLVAAQDPASNGGTTFFAQGAFLERDEPGFRDVRPILVSEYVRISAHEGVLAGFAASRSFNNPLWDYTGTDPTLPRARDIDGNALPSDGAHEVVAVYNFDGTLLN